LLLAAAFALTLFGCGENPAEIADDGTLRVVTTVNAWYDIARTVAGDDAEVTSLVPDGVEIHDFEPSAKDIASLANADLIILNGLGLEYWFNANQAGEDATVLTMEYLLPNFSGLSDARGGAVNPHIWLSPTYAAQAAELFAAWFGEYDELHRLDYAARGS